MADAFSSSQAAVVQQYDADYAEAVVLPAVPELAFNLTTPHLLAPLPVAQYFTPLSALVTVASLSDLSVNSRNVGRHLITTVIRRPFKFPVATSSPEVLVVDGTGTPVRVHICGLDCADDRAALEHLLPVGCALVLVHPFYREQTDGVRVLRVERPCEVRICLASQNPHVARAITLSATTLSASSLDDSWRAALAAATAHKQRGNDAFKAAQHEAAVNAYLEGALSLLDDLPSHLDVISDAATHPPLLVSWRLPDPSQDSAAILSTGLDLLATLLCNASTASFKRGYSRQSLYLAHASLLYRKALLLTTTTVPDDSAQAASQSTAMAGETKARLRLVAALLDLYRLDAAHAQLNHIEATLTDSPNGASLLSDVRALRLEWTQKSREMETPQNLARWLLGTQNWRRDRSFVHPALEPTAGISSEGTPSPSEWVARETLPQGTVLMLERVFSCRRPADSAEALTAFLDHLEDQAASLLPLFTPVRADSGTSASATASASASEPASASASEPVSEPVSASSAAAVAAACAKKTRLGSWMHISEATIERLGWALRYRSEVSTEGGTDTVAIGGLSSALPHACAPNVHVLCKGTLAAVVSTRPIVAGERVTRSWCPTCLPTVLRRARLQHSRDVTACACDRCTRRGVWASGDAENAVSEFRCPVCSHPTVTTVPSAASSLTPAADVQDGVALLSCGSVAGCTWPGALRADIQSGFHRALVALDNATASDACHEKMPELVAEVDRMLPEGSWLRAMWWCRLGRRAAAQGDVEQYTTHVVQLKTQFDSYAPPVELRCFVVDMICQALSSSKRAALTDDEYALLLAFGLSKSLMQASLSVSEGSVAKVYAALC